jgi:hypothetical protein
LSYSRPHQAGTATARDSSSASRLLIGFREEHLNGNKLCKTPANARKPMHTDPSTILNGFIREQRKNRPDPSWGLIERRGRRYYIHEKTLNSLIGMRMLPGIAPASQQGHRGIDHFGHFAGLTASLQLHSMRS